MSEMSVEQSRNWAMWAHLSSFVFFLGIPGFIGPLIIFLTYKDRNAYIRHQAKESLNFQLSFIIYTVLALISVVVLVGFVLFPAVAIFWLVFVIKGAVAASKGEEFRYPLTIAFIK